MYTSARQLFVLQRAHGVVAKPSEIMTQKPLWVRCLTVLTPSKAINHSNGAFLGKLGFSLSDGLDKALRIARRKLHDRLSQVYRDSQLPYVKRNKNTTSG